jgi:hypothetical protein
VRRARTMNFDVAIIQIACYSAPPEVKIVRNFPNQHRAPISLSILLASAAYLFYSRGSAAEPVAFVQSVQWNMESAVAAGTGCFLGVDTMVAVSGGDVSVVFTNLGVALGSGQGEPSRDVRTCTVRLPAVVPLGFFPARVLQTLTYGIRKSAASSASLTTSATFFTVPVRMPSITVDAGLAVNGGAFAAIEDESFSAPSAAYASFCSVSRQTNGMLAANFSANGKISRASDELLAFVDDFDLRWDLSPTLSQCGR